MTVWGLVRLLKGYSKAFDTRLSPLPFYNVFISIGLLAFPFELGRIVWKALRSSRRKAGFSRMCNGFGWFCICLKMSFSVVTKPH